MKRVLLLLSLVALASVSCKKEQNTEGGSAASKDASFTVSFSPLEYAVRAGVLPDLSIAPAVEDELAVLDGSTVVSFVPLSFDSAQAVYEGQLSEGAEKTPLAAFPRSAVKGMTAAKTEFEIPAGQGGSSVPVLAVGRAGEDGTILLKNVPAYLEFPVEEGVTAVVVSGMKGEKIAGTIAVNPETGALKEETGGPEIVYVPEEGAATGLVALAPLSFEEGLAVQMVSESGGKTWITGAVTADRGMVLKLAEITESVASSYSIASVADLLAWADAYESWTALDVVTLTADIDMQEVSSWTPRNFGGTFIGGGHRIYNFSHSATGGNAGFFNNMTGTLSDVVFGSQDGSAYDGASSISLSGVDDGNWHYAGIVARNNGAIKNVTSFVPVSVAASCTFKVRAGGIAGTNIGATTIEGCVNRGNVSAPLSGKTESTETIFGGILGCCDTGEAMTIKNCTNYGDVISGDSHTVAVGGIVGNAPGAKIAHIEGCHNYGAVALNSTANVTAGFVGGIAGFLNGNGTRGNEIRDCVNHADLLCTGPSLNGFGGIIGRGTSTDVTGCTNEGSVRFHADVAGQQIFVGGIAGYFYSTDAAGSSSITGCTNSGAVSSDKNQVNCIGGIVGTLRGKGSGQTHTLSDNVNSGSVTILRTEFNSNWQACGGIAGEQESSTATISGNRNGGSVRIEVNNTTTHKAGLTAGGIIGYAATTTAGTKTTLGGNSNTGDVTLLNSGASDSAQCAGGVAGHFVADASSSGDSSVCSVSRTVEGSGGGAGAAVGVNEGAVSNPVLGGSVNGTQLNSGNLSSLAVGSGNAATGATLAN